MINRAANSTQIFNKRLFQGCFEELEKTGDASVIFRSSETLLGAKRDLFLDLKFGGPNLTQPMNKPHQKGRLRLPYQILQLGFIIGWSMWAIQPFPCKLAELTWFRKYPNFVQIPWWFLIVWVGWHWVRLLLLVWYLKNTTWNNLLLNILVLFAAQLILWPTYSVCGCHRLDHKLPKTWINLFSQSSSMM